MISIKNTVDIEKMRRAGKIAKKALALGGTMVKPGETTKAIDSEIKKLITSYGATPSFYGYNRGGSKFPGNSCISLNNEVIHGIPSAEKRLKAGDLVKIDVGAFVGGFHGDCADTFYCGDEKDMDAEMKKLVEVTRQSFFEGIKFASAGNRLGDVGFAIESYVVSHGYSVVRECIGHGIGKKLHEPPDVPNFGVRGRGTRLSRGMTIAIEPMVNAGTCEVQTLPDKWTITTKDGKLSAHYENTVCITDGQCDILTLE